MRPVVKLLVLTVAHAIACAPAFADVPRPAAIVADTVDEVDLLRAQLAEANAREARTRAEAMELLAIQARGELRAKYHIGDADSIDLQTRQIRRAPKPPTHKSANPNK
jgi:hypothetical protein